MNLFFSCTNCESTDLVAELYEGYFICNDCFNELSEDLEIPYAPI